MFNADEFFQIGKVVKASGNIGEVLIFLEKGEYPELSKLESVFIRLHGNLVPFFIEHNKKKSNSQYLLKFLDFESPDETEEIIGNGVFLPINLKLKQRKIKSSVPDLKGYRVLDHHFGEVGLVRAILEFPMQEILEIEHSGKIILVPLVDEIITGIDPKRKILMIEAPEGLIELYLGEE